VPNEPVKAVGLKKVDPVATANEDAEPMTEFQRRWRTPQESANSGDDEPRCRRDTVAVDRPTIRDESRCGGSHANTIAMIIKGTKIQRLEGSSRRPLSQTACSRKVRKRLRPAQCQNDHACPRRIGKRMLSNPPHPPNDEREKREACRQFPKRQVLDGAPAKQHGAGSKKKKWRIVKRE